MTARIDLKPGDAVMSLAGRDKGRPMAVITTVDGKYALVCDGRKRRLEAPKRKKTVHLSFIGYTGISVDENLTNKKVWKSLRPYRESAGTVSGNDLNTEDAKTSSKIL